MTTVLDWAHVQNTPEHTDASIAALHDAGLRAVFGFGLPTAEDRGHRYPDDLLRLRREVFATDNQLLTLALATMSPEHGPERSRSATGRSRARRRRDSVHAGIAGFGKPGEIERFGREGMLGPDVTLVHCAALTPAEWRLVADTGTTVSISTQVELRWAMARRQSSARWTPASRPA